MTKDWPKRAIQEVFRTFGLEVHRVPGSVLDGSSTSAHAFDHTFERLMALRALGFYPADICDIGASDGRWSLKCLEVFPEARYFCVDPLDENRAFLEQLRARYPNVHYWSGCLGSQTEVVTLNADGDGSSILPGHTGNAYGIQRTVRVETLDNLILKEICPQPDLVKLDVQGYELEVLKGAARALTKIQAVIAEVSFLPFQKGMPVFYEVVGQLAEYGFAVYDILSLSMRPLDGAPAQTDLLFLRTTHPLRNSNKWDRDSVY